MSRQPFHQLPINDVESQSNCIQKLASPPIAAANNLRDPSRAADSRGFAVVQPNFTESQTYQEELVTYPHPAYTQAGETNNNQEPDSGAERHSYHFEDIEAAIREIPEHLLRSPVDEEDERLIDDIYSLFNSNQEIVMANQINGTNQTNGIGGQEPYVEIVEQPAKCSLRFRYKCEGRSAGSLPGVNSTADNKTFPAIRIANYVGRAVVVISCVTKDAPYRVHPHNIVGKEGCKKGICTIVIPNNDPTTSRSFTSLGIQCVKRKDIEESLAQREHINVDPFRNGFSHKADASNIDLNVIRLCFQVFVQGENQDVCRIPLPPVVSEPIHDKKAMSDLVITKLSHCSAPATGSREVILLCDRISKDDIQIRFFEERDGKLIWETFTKPTDVHKQVAICFETPKYYNENITQPAMAQVQLRRISDNQHSEPRRFQFLPCESDEDIISRKRLRIGLVNKSPLIFDNRIVHNAPQQNQDYQQHHQHQFQMPPDASGSQVVGGGGVGSARAFIGYENNVLSYN